MQEHRYAWSQEPSRRPLAGRDCTLWPPPQLLQAAAAAVTEPSESAPWQRHVLPRLTWNAKAALPVLQRRVAVAGAHSVPKAGCRTRPARVLHSVRLRVRGLRETVSETGVCVSLRWVAGRVGR